MKDYRTRNFTLSEIIHSDFKSFPEELLPIAYQVIGYVQSLRDAINSPLNINSGYRSAGYNATLKNAAANSYHIWRYLPDGHMVWAVDVSSPIMPASELIKLIAPRVFGEVYEHTTLGFVHMAPGLKDETFKI